nr:MAG TPA: hypothetical protein [Caudoviricetes sp.]
MKVNTHGLKMIGLKAASGETQGISYYSGQYVQISYDLDEGRVYADWHLTVNDYRRYHNPRIITACGAREPMTMQKIADCVAAAVCEWEALKEAE